MINKNCIICNKIFETKYGSRKLCYDNHYVKCSVCGKTFVSIDIPLLKKYKDGDVVTCDSRSCRHEARKIRSLNKYGVESHLQLPEMRKKIYNSYIINHSSKDNINIIDKYIRCSSDKNEFISKLDNYNIKHYEDNDTIFINNGNCSINFVSSSNIPHSVSEDYYYKHFSRLLKDTILSKYCDCTRYITVFDWDDTDKIIDLISNKITVFSRKCTVRKVNKSECDNFLELYHLQNSCAHQTIRYGLYYNDELIELMTFGRPRYSNTYQYELLRLCTKAGYVVPGGAKRLLTHFIRDYSPFSIISYCDTSKFNGSVYEQIGFEYMYTTSPRRHWYKEGIHITDNLLMQHGYDRLFGTKYGNQYNNIELMEMNGFKSIYDCGQSVYALDFGKIDQNK